MFFMGKGNQNPPAKPNQNSGCGDSQEKRRWDHFRCPGFSLVAAAFERASRFNGLPARGRLLKRF
jgi:hypothetical protein